MSSSGRTSPAPEERQNALVLLLDMFSNTDPNYVKDVLQAQRWEADDAIQFLLMTETPSAQGTSSTRSTTSTATATPSPQQQQLASAPPKALPPPVAVGGAGKLLSSSPVVANTGSKLPPPLVPMVAPVAIRASMPVVAPPPPLINKSPGDVSKPIGFTVNFREVANKSEEDIADTAKKWTGMGSHIVVSLTWTEETRPYDKAAHAIVMGMQRVNFTPILLLTNQEYARAEPLAPPRLPSFKNTKAIDSFVAMALSLGTAKLPYICLRHEINVVYADKQDELDLFYVVYKMAAKEIKKLSQNTKIFVSFNYEAAVSRPAEFRAMIDNLMPDLDLFAISTFPSDVYPTPSAIPNEYFSALASMMPKNIPVAIVETGWSSQKNEIEQRDYIVRLPQLLAASSVYPMWTCWTEYIDRASQQSAGLIRADGKSKQSRVEWESMHQAAVASLMKSPLGSPKSSTSSSTTPTPSPTPTTGHSRKPSDLTPPPPLPQAVVNKSAPLPRPIMSPPPPLVEVPLTSDQLATMSGAAARLLASDPDTTLTVVDDCRPEESLLLSEVEGYLMDKALDYLERRPSFNKILSSQDPHLITAKVVYETIKKVQENFLPTANIISLTGAQTEFYDGTKLTRFIAQEIDDVVDRVLLDKGWLSAMLERYANETQFNLQAAEDQGPRPYMEDRNIMFKYLDVITGLTSSVHRLSYFAVFDGHGGTAVAAYVRTHLHVNFVRSRHFPSNIRGALQDAFLKTNEELFRFMERRSLPLNVGSTGVVCVLYKKDLYIAWVGDSEAALVKNNGDVMKFVTCHKASSDSERRRIIAAGGVVSEVNGMARVMGMLAVSRAFGDQTLFPYVNSNPEISSYMMAGNEGMLVLGCDGLWDVFTPFEIEDFAIRYRSMQGSLVGMSENLAKFARARGSTDNITVLLVEFGAPP